MVPPMTFAPTSLVTGIDSPVTIDSSTRARPRGPRHRPAPSRRAARAAGRRRNVLERDVFVVPSSDAPRRLRREVEQRRIAPEVCSRARSSSTWPSSTSTVMTAAASK
jgi:hypothetical protein